MEYIFTQSKTLIFSRHLTTCIRICSLISLVILSATPGRGAGMQMLHNHIPAAMKFWAPAAHLPGTNHLNLAISLPLRNTSALSNLLQQIYDPTSPSYHHYLTPDQFAERFGPTKSDYQAVIAFAKKNHLQVTVTHPNRLLLDVNGSVTDVEQALHIALHTYQHPTENRKFFAPDTEPSLDLTVPVLHISGLDNYSLPRPHLMAKPLVDGQNAASNAGSGPSGTYLGKDFRAAYVPDTTLTGAGQTVGLFQLDGYASNDIAYYESKAGLPSVPLQNVLIDGATGLPSFNGGEVEVSLDIEMVVSMATNLSKVIVYMAPDGSPFVDILNRMATDNQAAQLSCSWYVPGGAAEPAADTIFQQMAAQGQSFFNASGDNDAYTGLIDFPGDDPYITQVGGTTLTTTGPGGSWVSETVWNSGGGVGSGGGISTQYSIPNWQTNISMTANQGSTTKRNTPDVSLTANKIYVRADGSDYNVVGTSCAAPLWAGFAALVNQQAANNGQPAIGFINPALQTIGTSVNYTAAFHDITTGNNESSTSPSKFLAVNGYDLCTGWGSPLGQQLINVLANIEALLITPAKGFNAVGAAGGPFTITTQSFTLTNVGAASLTWTLSNTPSWLSASSTGGTVIPGGAANTVIVGLNNAASNLVVGTYSAILWFTNLADNVGQGRQFTLTIISPPNITQQPQNQSVIQGTAAQFSVQATGGLPLGYQWQDNGTNLVDNGNISGSMTTNLVINNVSITNIGTYTVIVSNNAGITTSSNASLSIIPSAPIFILQPTNLTVQVGGTAAFAVTAGGTAPLSFQWSLNGTNISGATNTSLSLSNVQLTNAGNYIVTVTNLYGATNSATAVLTVSPPPPCDPTPSGIVAWWAAESNALDSVGFNNGTLMNGTGFAAGKVGTAFNLDGVDDYVLAVSTNLNVGSGSGMTFEAWINPTTTATQMPVFEYERVLGSRTGSDIGPLLYINLPSAAAFYVNLVDAGGTGHVFNSSSGYITAGVWQHVALTYDKSSGIATIYLNGTNVAQSNLGSFTLQTTFTNFLLGARTYFGSATSPSDKFSGKMDELSLYNRALSSNEITAIYLAGSIGKCPVPPTILVQPTNQSVMISNTATLKVTASGTRPLNYQWYLNGTNLVNATNATLSLLNAQLTNAGSYSVFVANAAGFTNSSNAVLTVQAPPLITAQPTNQTVAAGGSTSFSVTVNGTQTLYYQWKLNGTNISGATNLTLALTNVQLTNGGNYSISITNLFGSTLSSNGTLIVQAPPIIITQPTNLTVNVGTTAIFAATVTGSTPLYYQWNFNGANNPVTGATNTTLTITNIQLAGAGVYTMTVTNLFGQVVSSNAILTVVDVLDHFVWNTVPSPRFINAPFPVTVRAMDSINQLFTNFTGTVFLTATNGASVNPAISTAFGQGAWTGSITISQTISNLVLRASDGAGHVGLANSINVTTTPMLSMTKSGNSLLIFWPMDPAGFVLESSTNMVPGQWTQVFPPPFPVGNQYLESVQLNNNNQFYRLRFTLP